jgi:DNA repair exonuclease SbcCD nuclease subunit
MKTLKFSFRPKIWGILWGILFSGNLLAQPDTLSFLHISDTHLIFNLDFYRSELAEPREHYGEGVEPLKQFLLSASETTNCDFITITGDLIDFFEMETKDEKMLGFQIEQFSRVMDESLVPVFTTLGNHDIAAYSWVNGEKVTSQNVAGRARADWIKNGGCFTHGTYYSRVYEVGTKTYRLIFLDDAYNKFQPEENVELPYIDKPQMHWLNAQLQQSDDDIEIVLMHVPIVPANSPADPSCELYSLLAKYPSSKMILAGHNHKSAIRDFYSAENNRITQVQTEAFGRGDGNWRLIRLTENKILVSSPGRIDSELEILID